jgi:GTP-binding protein
MKLNAQFIKSAPAPELFPQPGAPEIAFLGRSNVGKSSLLNSLIGTKLAHVSSTPGRTQMINFFALRFGSPDSPPDLILADLPGYGYAKAPRELVRSWANFVDPYIVGRPTLRLCIALVDSNVPPQSSDLQLAEWLRHHGRDFQLVATKVDRLSGNALAKSLKSLKEAFATEPLPYSAKTGRGRAELLKVIKAVAQSTQE